MSAPLPPRNEAAEKWLLDEATLDFIGREIHFWSAYSDSGIEWDNLSEASRESYRGVAERVMNALVCHWRNDGAASPTTTKKG